MTVYSFVILQQNLNRIERPRAGQSIAGVGLEGPRSLSLPVRSEGLPIGAESGIETDATSCSRPPRCAGGQ